MTAMSTNTNNLPMTPATPAPLTRDQAAQLIALLQAAQAGTPATGTGGALVPGDPITVRDLVDKALVKLEHTSSKRTYGTYLRLLRDGLDVQSAHAGDGAYTQAMSLPDGRVYAEVPSDQFSPQR
jgi:hypothetical protein